MLSGKEELEATTGKGDMNNKRLLANREVHVWLVPQIVSALSMKNAYLKMKSLGFGGSEGG
jgi:hypothetical protein